MFNSKKNNKDNNKRFFFKFFGLFITIFNFIAIFFIYLNPKKWDKFVKKEKKELNEFKKRKQNLPMFFKNSKLLLKDLFIPYEGNNHAPKSLRPKPLISYALAIIAVKILVLGFLFINYPTQAELSAIISANIINLVNNSRKEAGIDLLVENKNLANFAYAKGQDMIAKGYFSHDSPEGKKPWQWIDKKQYDYIYAGENLAMDFTNAEAVHNAFLKSPTHKKNILNQKYKEIGVAAITGELNGHETILLVQFFGTQRKDFNKIAKTEEKSNQIPLNEPAEKSNSVSTSSPIVAGKQLVEWQPSADGVIVVSTDKNSFKSAFDLAIEYSNIFFFAFLIFLTLCLLINIFVKIKVQHTWVIMQSLAVIALVLAMVSIKFHFIEQVAPQILIL